jgi:DNA-binding beta-propeller fold protein YncE
VLFGGREDPRMLQPYGIAVGPDGRVYVADTVGRAIHVYNLDTPGYSTIEVDGDSLIGVALVGGRIFVTDSASGRLICLDARGRTVWTRGPRDGFMRPTGIVAAQDRLYVVDTLQHRVIIVGLAGNIVGGFGSHGVADGQFNLPTNIARGADGRLYVADTMNFRVQVFDRDGQFLRTFGQLGDGSGDLNRAKGVGVDSEGHIYVVDGLHDVVQVFDNEGHLLLGFGESGSGDGQFWLPTGLTIANDVVYVADSANHRIEVFRYLRTPR